MKKVILIVAVAVLAMCVACSNKNNETTNSNAAKFAVTVNDNGNIDLEIGEAIVVKKIKNFNNSDPDTIGFVKIIYNGKEFCDENNDWKDNTWYYHVPVIKDGDTVWYRSKDLLEWEKI